MLLPWLWQWFTMFSLHCGSILDHEYGIKNHDHEITMGNHAQPWKHGFYYSRLIQNYTSEIYLKLKEVRLLISHSMHHPFSAWGVQGLDSTSIFRWDLLRKRGGDLFQGDCCFYIKNKQKSKVFRLNDKESFFMGLMKKHYGMGELTKKGAWLTH